MTALRVPVIYGSVRTARRGILAARFVVRRLRARGHEPTLVDPLAFPLPLLDRMYKEYPQGEAPAPLEELATLYRGAHAFVIVSGEYNHGMPPALKNLLDHFLEEYFFRPSGIVCYSQGAFGGVRAAMQLRATLGELGMPSVSSILPIPQVQRQFTEEGVPHDDAWNGRADRFLADLEWWAHAARRHRADQPPPY